MDADDRTLSGLGYVCVSWRDVREREDCASSADLLLAYKVAPIADDGLEAEERGLVGPVSLLSVCRELAREADRGSTCRGATGSRYLTPELRKEVVDGIGLIRELGDIGR